MTTSLVQLEAISKSYVQGQRVVSVLRELSLTIAPGDFVAVSGPSGGGKSTMLLAAGGLLRPERGRVLIDAQDIYALPNGARCRIRADRLGFVFQQFHLVPYLTVRENILAARLGCSRSLALPAMDQAAQLMSQLNLAERADHKPAELSVGECQRVSLARAMLNCPALILADEPTGNLDEGNAAVVLRHLAEFASAGGAVLLVTHSSWAASHANRRFLLEQGILQTA
jgi:putative ABC transport system ATP-binding protein